MGREWGSGVAGGIMRLGHAKSLGRRGAFTLPPTPLLGQVGRPSYGPTFKSQPRSGPTTSCTPGNKYGGGGVDHAAHLNGSSPSTSGDTDGVVSQSAPSESGSDHFRGSDVSFLSKSRVVRNSGPASCPSPHPRRPRPCSSFFWDCASVSFSWSCHLLLLEKLNRRRHATTERQQSSLGSPSWIHNVHGQTAVMP